MAFFFKDTKREAATVAGPKKPSNRGHIPIESMNKLGCAACPRDKDESLLMPKSEADGVDNPLIYMLSTAPTWEEDQRGELWSGIAGRAILSKLSGAAIRNDVRMHNVVNCRPADSSEMRIDTREIECCRGRVVADIERSKPVVVVGVGDEVLHWATGLPRNAMAFRGTMIATRIGRHACWYYPVLYPNYTKGGKRSSRKSEYEWATEHDMRFIEDKLANGLTFPELPAGPYDRGIEQITGTGHGDMVLLEEAMHWLCSLDHFGMDYETTGIKPQVLDDARLLTVAAGTFDRVVAFPVEHELGWGTETRIRRVKGMVGEMIAQSGRKRCHNLGFEQEWTRFLYGERVLRRTEWEDTMGMAYVFDSRSGTKGLDEQCRIHFGFFLKAQSRVDVRAPRWWMDYPLKEILRYNGMDSKWTDLLADRQLARLESEPGLRDVYERRVQLSPTLVMMAARGMPVDIEYARQMITGIQAKLEVIESKVRADPAVRRYTAQHGTFSVGNDGHVLKLMKMLGREEIRVEDYAGNVSYTSGEEALSAMPVSEVPVAPLVLEHRTLYRNESTYLRPLVEGRAIRGGRIYYDYSSMHTVTGRLNSDAHNWPKHKHREVRGAVSALPGEWMVACDYGQLQFRIAGMYSQDTNIVKACWTGYDVHRFWAERMVAVYPRIKDSICDEFRVDWDKDGIKTLRQAAKNGWVFPLLFGATWQGCAGRMRIPEDEAEQLAGEFWDEFREHLRWQEGVIKFYERHLYVETMGGFRRRGPTTRNELINLGIQGTESEIVCAAMNSLSERADMEEDPELQFAFHGHDDLSFFIGDANLERNIATIAREMCEPRFDYINVPMIVEVSVGSRWDNLKEIAKYSSEQLFNLDNPYR